MQTVEDLTLFDESINFPLIFSFKTLTDLINAQKLKGISEVYGTRSQYVSLMWFFTFKYTENAAKNSKEHNKLWFKCSYEAHTEASFHWTGPGWCGSVQKCLGRGSSAPMSRTTLSPWAWARVRSLLCSRALSPSQTGTWMLFLQAMPSTLRCCSKQALTDTTSQTSLVNYQSVVLCNSSWTWLGQSHTAKCVRMSDFPGRLGTLRQWCFALPFTCLPQSLAPNAQ